MPDAAQRIVSLLPSATEIVCALGAGARLRGISHSCDFPAAVNGLPVLTRTEVPVHAGQQAIDQFVRTQLAAGQGLYQLDLSLLAALAPDVIISQTLCDVCAVSAGDVYQALADLPGEPALVELAASSLDDVLDDILRSARAIGEPEAGLALVANLRARIQRVAERPPLRGERVLFLEWLQPPFSGGHWIPDLISLLGGRACLAQSGAPSRSVSWDAIAACDPDLIVVACCGYDQQSSQQALAALQAHPVWQQLRAVQQGRVLTGDGNAHFSRAGPRLVDGLEWLAASL